MAAGSPSSRSSSLGPGRRPQAPAGDLHDDVACLVCGGREPRTVFSMPPYRIVRCPGCNLVYTLPRLPSEHIREMYQSDYWRSAEAKHFGYTDYLKDAPLYLRTFRMRSRLVDRYLSSPGRILEVGCAAGFFLKVMQEKGWETIGVELSQQMVDYARAELALPDVRSGTLLDQDLEEKSFDAITFWDVVEHLEDPRPTLIRARELLKDDGIVIIETQNVESPFAKLMGRRWQHYKFEEHLWHFSKRTLALLLDAVGFEVREASARRGGKYVSLDFVIERAGRIHPVLSHLLRPFRFMGRLAVYVNPFDEIIAVARKKAGL
ncbi:MAG: class I SAM-dependent methyltransferase [Planctomycetota bacterium]